ncbi:hypothetical protein PGB90_003785 [Kerria lacca]
MDVACDIGFILVCGCVEIVVEVVTVDANADSDIVRLTKLFRCFNKPKRVGLLVVNAH